MLGNEGQLQKKTFFLPQKILHERLYKLQEIYETSSIYLFAVTPIGTFSQFIHNPTSI